jgi:hypothetical protein
VLTWMVRADMFPLLGREFMVGEAEHVHLDAGRDQSNRRANVFGNARRGVQGDPSPDVLDVALRQAVTFQEVAGGVGAVDLEAQVLLA